MTTIGFIGLGHMGLHMARNLIKSAGTKVIGFDLSAESLKALSQAGGTVARNVAEVAAGSDVIITMLPKGQHLEAVMLGDEGVLAHAKPASLFIDSSTIDIETSVRLAGLAAEHGHQFIDAPVSGGEKGARDGTLSFMVGGDDAAFERAKPVLAKMGANLFHVGANGSGLAVKLVNNMLLGICMAATSEAFNLIEKLGVDARAFHAIASRSTGANWALEKNCPVPGVVETSPANNAYRPGFATNLMLKDLALSQQVAIQLNVPSPLGSAAMSVFSVASQSGLGNEDMSAVIKLFAGKTYSQA